jgi:hypothetical protein
VPELVEQLVVGALANSRLLDEALRPSRYVGISDQETDYTD